MKKTGVPEMENPPPPKKRFVVNKEIAINQSKYLEKYKEIIVTYHDGETKVFTPINWATFEKGVRKVAKNIKFVPLKVDNTGVWSKVKTFLNIKNK